MRVALLALLVPGCALFPPSEASVSTIAASFAPFRDATIQGEDAQAFLRRRTATLVGGVQTLRLEGDGDEITPDTQFATDDEVTDGRRTLTGVQGAAAALSTDGYFLTAAHDLARGPTHLVLEVGGSVHVAPARVVWTAERDDVALLHADLQPEACFILVPDRPLAERETLLTFSHRVGFAAGELEAPVDLSSLTYDTLALPHDTPLRRGFSGGPAVTLDGELLGVQTNTGMDTLWKRRSWLARVRPAKLRELIEEDRRTGPE